MLAVALFLAAASVLPVSGDVPVSFCRSFCGNVTVDYPFALRAGCGHSAFRDLLFCINGVLMFHLPSGSYRVLAIDYAYRSLTLQDATLSDCRRRRSPATGFVVEPWRAPYLAPVPDNAFLLLGCRADSPLFQGFPGRRLNCRTDVGGMGCADYYACPAWDDRRPADGAYGAAAGPPECCAVAWEAVRAVNLTRLGCEGYSSAYALAPLRTRGPGEWSYGIRVGYSVPADDFDACRACQATGGLCGFDAAAGGGGLCLCEGWNSTSNCDSGSPVGSSGMSVDPASQLLTLFSNLLVLHSVAWISAL